MIRVTYQRTPPKWEHCKTFGHNSDCCNALVSGDLSAAKQRQEAKGSRQDNVWRVVGQSDKLKAVVEDLTDQDEGVGQHWLVAQTQKRT